MHGCSNLLADSFIRGAKENGHVVTETDAAHIHITPCTGCKACNFSGQPCRIKDDMTEVKKEILAADMYDGAMFSYQGDFLDYLGLENMGVFTAHGSENGSAAKLDELKNFGASL